MSVFCLGSDQIERYWQSFEAHIYRLERLGYVGADELRDDLKLAKRQLWGYQDGPTVLGISITRIAGKTCEIVAAVGRQSKSGQLEEVYAAIEKWAREIGCIRIRVIGRKGWLRKFPEFTQTGIVIEKELV